MTSSRKPIVLFIAAVAAAVVVAMVIIAAKPTAKREANEAEKALSAAKNTPGARAQSQTGTPADLPSVPNFVAPVEPETPLSKTQINEVMQDWQKAILARNPEVVEKIDGEFRDRPEEFLPAITDCALTNKAGQVRAFCTKVLGNLRRPDSIPSLHKLLSDPHEYVRLNAAWALGELRDAGAVPTLTKMAQADASPAVRTAAAESLGRLRSP